MLLPLLLALSLFSSEPTCLGSSNPKLLVPARRAAGHWQVQAGSASQAWLVAAERAAAVGQRRLAQAAAPPAANAAEAEQAQALAEQQQAQGAAPAPEQAQLEQAQASADATPAAETPALDGQAAAQECLELHMRFNEACQVGIDRSALYFPRGSTKLPTAEQREQALAALQAGGLPAKGCCQAVTAALAARCGCNR
jgi:hypothetical protein